MKLDRHHLLEIILWPNHDGTFIKILNSSAYLKELDIYDDFKLTISLSHSAHAKLHANNRSADWHNKLIEHTKHKSEATRRKLHDTNVGKLRSQLTKARISANSAWKGKHLSKECKAKMSAAHVGKTSPNKGRHWKLVNGKRTYY